MKEEVLDAVRRTARRIDELEASGRFGEALEAARGLAESDPERYGPVLVSLEEYAREVRRHRRRAYPSRSG